MCLLTSDPVVVDALRKAIDAFTEANQLFTAYDASRKARKDTGKVLGSHTRTMAPIVRELWRDGEFTVDYEQTLVDLNVAGNIQQAFVYHPRGTDPYSYDPGSSDITVVQPGASPVVDDDAEEDEKDDDIVSSPGSVICQSTKEGRITVPRDMLKEMNLVANDNVYINHEGNNVVIQPVPRGGRDDDYALKVNHDGRVRLSTNILRSKFSLNGKRFELTLNTGTHASQSKIVILMK